MNLHSKEAAQSFNRCWQSLELDSPWRSMTSTISRLLELEFVLRIKCDMQLGTELFRVSLAQDAAPAAQLGFVLYLSSCLSSSQEAAPELPQDWTLSPGNGPSGQSWQRMECYNRRAWPAKGEGLHLGQTGEVAELPLTTWSLCSEVTLRALGHLFSQNMEKKLKFLQ